MRHLTKCSEIMSSVSKLPDDLSVHHHLEAVNAAVEEIQLKMDSVMLQTLHVRKQLLLAYLNISENTESVRHLPISRYLACFSSTSPPLNLKPDILKTERLQELALFIFGYDIDLEETKTVFDLIQLCDKDKMVLPH